MGHMKYSPEGFGYGKCELHVGTNGQVFFLAFFYMSKTYMCHFSVHGLSNKPPHLFNLNFSSKMLDLLIRAQIYGKWGLCIS